MTRRYSNKRMKDKNYFDFLIRNWILGISHSDKYTRLRYIYQYKRKVIIFSEKRNDYKSVMNIIYELPSLSIFAESILIEMQIFMAYFAQK